MVAGQGKGWWIEVDEANRNKDRARRAWTGIADRAIEVSHQVHSHPETAFKEERSSAALCRFLESNGMTVERGVADLETAFLARAGSGSFHVALCAEYDSLPGIGHACGHNIIGSASAAAGILLTELADDLDLTVSVIGTPAEEIGDAGGKVVMVERGIFDDVDVAMMVHPGPADVMAPPMLACATFDVHYRGVEAHASAFPERGVNAADAMTIAQTAIGLLRQQMRSGDRVHGVITHGGDAPNVIPGHTSARYIVRSRTLADLEEAKKRILCCFEAGALASGATLEIVGGEQPYAHMLHAMELAEMYRSNATVLGRSFPDFGRALERSAASTDMGNVSLRVPSIHPIISVEANGSVPHQPEFAKHCVSESADRAVGDGAISLAWTAIDAANPDSRAQFSRKSRS